jgi:starch-binding outer membrane protein, SusD/RagB family
MNKFRNIVLTVLALSASVGCEKYMDPSVDQEIIASQAVSTPADLKAVVLGIHDRLNAVGLYGRDMYVSGDVMSDNAFANGATNRFITQSNFDFITNNGFALGVWAGSYAAISNCNLVINADVASSEEVDYSKGQAYALRALNHLNLLMWFGQQYVTGGTLGVPYVKTYATGDLYPSRNTVAEVYDNILADLVQAATLMQTEVATPSLNEGVEYMNYYAVKALQSRAYLYAGKNAEAIAAADVVINSGDFSLLSGSSYVDAWVSGSGPSSLFEVAFTSTDRLGTDNIARIYRPTNYGDVEVSADLYNAFDAADIRRTLYEESAGTYRVVNKYVDELGTDNVRVIRYEEVLLNKAEALSKTGGQAAALTIINQIATARGGATYAAGTTDNVLKERRLELAMEGHRFFDLARNGKSIPLFGTIRAVPGFATSLPYGNYRFALPIPQAEIDANSNMVQNTGYGN